MTAFTSLKDANKRIEELENELVKFKESPYFESLIAISIQQSDWNQQLQTQKIDLFADKESKEFDRTKWYIENMLDICNTKAELLKKISPEEIKEADKKIGDQKIKRRIGMAEKIASNGTE